MTPSCLCNDVMSIQCSVLPQDLFDSHKCECENGYFGENCELEINECSAPGPCEHGGNCVDLVAGFECECLEDYEVGTLEPLPVSLFIPSHPPSISLPPFLQGRVCEIYLNSCSSGPCQNGGTCENLPNSFNCTCPAGYTGFACETNINDCEPDPCQNGMCEVSPSYIAGLG